MIVTPIKTRIFRENEDLIAFIRAHVKKIPERSVLVVTSKIVALAEGRVMSLASEREKAEVIKRESEYAIKTKWAWLTIRDGAIMASAGIDESNANGKMILFPKDCHKSAKKIYKKIKKLYKLKKFGILITDSRIMPLRSGTVGMGMGFFGFKWLKSYIGKSDIFGRRFEASKVNVADSLATSAVFCMGEGRERMPLAIIEDISVEWSERVSKKYLRIPLRDDLYRPLFVGISKRKRS